MGARQRAQARPKKGNAAKKSPKWSQKQSSSSLKVPDLDPSLRHRALLHDWQEFSDSSSPHPRNGMLSMGQEARNTERYSLGWGSTRLRDMTVTFVSAGNLVRDEPSGEKTESETEGQQDPTTTEDGAQYEPETSPLREVSEDAVEGGGLVNDVQEHVPTATPALKEAPAAVKPTPRSDSISSQSSEEILFAGRKNAGQPRLPRVHTPQSTPPIASVNNSSELPTAESSSDAVPQHVPSSPPRKFQAIPLRNKNVDRRGRPRLWSSKREEEEAIMNDYIANLAFDDDSDEEDTPEQSTSKPSRRNEHFRFFDGTAESNVKVQTKPAAGQAPQSHLPDQAIDWDSADLEDFDGLSTTDEEVVEVTQVLRHRVRPSGPQYLVTAPGQGTSEARWVLHAKLKSSSAREEIEIFNDIQAIQFQTTSDDQDDESGDDSEDDEVRNDVQDDMKSEDDENARLKAHTARMTDEQVARAFAKQAELGISGDELILFDGQLDGDDDDGDDGDVFLANDDFISFSSKHHLSSRGKSKRNRRQRDTFPPAEAFADALDQDPYGAFDIMDFDRPSLRPKKKGRTSDPFEWGLDDEDLAQHLHSSWSKDREKKTARKREKLEAREATLLEASERNDPVVIKAEIRQFLVQESDVLKLAPMDSTTRAAVHRLAKVLKLKSHSEGKDGRGVGRYPILTKGPHTPFYSVDTIWEIDNLMDSRKFFPKQRGGNFHGPNTPRVRTTVKARRGGGGGTMSGATYMNGEVVGGSAPELGADNKGRAMLEKMGWTSGMGIGAVGNKGGLDAIKHVVKTNKAGLG
nr:squalene synthetase-like protein [Exophiala xenobiotica]